MNKKSNRVMTLLLVLALLAGLFLLLYPTVSDYWNSLHQTRTITGYAENVAQLDRTEYEEMWAAAQRYNRTLPKRENAFALTEEQKREYESLLNASGNGVMGIVEIPKIGCPFITARTTRCCKSPWGIWNGRACPWAARGRTACFPAIGGCPAPGCSPIWISWPWVTAFCSACSTRR